MNHDQLYHMLVAQVCVCGMQLSGRSVIYLFMVN